MSVRNSALTIDELDTVAGGARVEVGPFYIDVQKGEVSIGVKGVATVTVWSNGGICGHVGGSGGTGGCL
ncbi:MAG: hypothetical protein PS018_23960 [bacterium]|nr:hypothetical protein [bacterium]